MDDEDDLVAHLDVCPECGAVASFHGLDPPPHCPHEYERFVPVRFVARDWRNQPDPDNAR